MKSIVGIFLTIQPTLEMLFVFWDLKFLDYITFTILLNSVGNMGAWFHG